MTIGSTTLERQGDYVVWGAWYRPFMASRARFRRDDDPLAIDTDRMTGAPSRGEHSCVSRASRA